jgi:hypothetical protein
MSKYSDEDRARIFEAAREALESAEAALAEPRPEIEPPVEDRAAKWRREAREQEERFARERAAGWPLTEYESSRIDQLSGQLVEQREFFLRLLPEIVAELQYQFEQKIAELSAEIGLLRADRTLDRALAKGEPSGEVLDLPNPLRRRVA